MQLISIAEEMQRLDARQRFIDSWLAQRPLRLLYNTDPETGTTALVRNDELEEEEVYPVNGEGLILVTNSRVFADGEHQSAVPSTHLCGDGLDLILVATAAQEHGVRLVEEPALFVPFTSKIIPYQTQAQMLLPYAQIYKTICTYGNRSLIEAMIESYLFKRNIPEYL